jgi:hypothetical protein
VSLLEDASARLAYLSSRILSDLPQANDLFV